MDTPNENKITLREAANLAAKAAAVALLVFLALFLLNFAMAGFITDEQAEIRAAEEKRLAVLRLQEDYDRANEYYEIADHYDGQFQEIFEKRVNADYIFIGTSHFTHGVTPEEFEVSGKKFFNFALNGSNPSYYLWWYSDVFKANRYVKPKAIIFGVDWFMFDTGWLWRRPEFDYQYLRRISRDPPDYDSGGAASEGEGDGAAPSAALRYTGKWYDIDGIATYITNRFEVFSYRSRFIDLIWPEKKEAESTGEDFVPEKKEKEPPRYYRTPDGFVLSSFYKGYVPWEQDFGGGSAGRAMSGMGSLETEKASFVSLLKQFEAEGIPVVFVMAPEYLPGRDAPQFDELTGIIADIARDFGIKFLNYNTDLASDINRDHTCYSDWGHLNDKGAHLFSKKLYEDLNPILGFDK